MGRDTKLTPELQEKIVKYIEDGNYIETACQASGIDKTTYYDWIRRADVYNNSNDDRVEGDRLYSYFAHAVKIAEAKAEALHVVNLKTAGVEPRFWAASATYLERKYPEKWGRREGIDINVQLGLKVLERLSQSLEKPLLVSTPRVQIDYENPLLLTDKT